MKWLWLITLSLLAALQYRLWVGEGSLAHVSQLKQQIAAQARENEQLLERNRVLTAEVIELKQGPFPDGGDAEDMVGLARE